MRGGWPAAWYAWRSMLHLRVLLLRLLTNDGEDDQSNHEEDRDHQEQRAARARHHLRSGALVEPRAFDGRNATHRAELAGRTLDGGIVVADGLVEGAVVARPARLEPADRVDPPAWPALPRDQSASAVRMQRLPVRWKVDWVVELGVRHAESLRRERRL